MQSAPAGDDDDVLARALLDLGLRASEYMSLTAREIDGARLHYRDAKSHERKAVDAPDMALGDWCLLRPPIGSGGAGP